MEDLFRDFAGNVALTLEALSVLIIAVGVIESLYRLLMPILARRDTHGARRAAWLILARWLVLSLEVMLAADIVRSAIAPSWNDIGQLAAIAVIRTFLNYFLERDLEEAAHSNANPRPTAETP